MALLCRAKVLVVLEMPRMNKWCHEGLRGSVVPVAIEDPWVAEGAREVLRAFATVLIVELIGNRTVARACELTRTVNGTGHTDINGTGQSRSQVRRYACCTATSDWTCPSLLPIVIVAAPNRSYDRRYVTARPGLRAERACVKLGKIIVPRRY